MRHSNIIDTPRPAGSEDLLGVERYINALINFISTAQMPTTLAIQGEWGSGKTSLMNQVRYHLCEMPDMPDPTKPYHGIWINTWQYSLMQAPEQVLLSVIRGVTSEVLDIMRVRHQSKLDGAIGKVGNIFGKIAKAGAKAAVSTVGVEASLVDELLQNGTKTTSGPEAFRHALSEAIRDCLEEDRKAGNSNRGFIFFIDDLDRLDPPVAVQILELLKNLFEVDNCIFILAIDYEVVVKGLEPKFGPLTEKNEREFRSFFDKIIQLPFTMPVNAYNVATYLKDALTGIGYYTPEELEGPVEGQEGRLVDILTEMILMSTGSNPRSVKRLINSLSLIQIMHATTGQGQPLTPREKMINFGFVCVQIAYPSIYDMLLHEPDFKGWDNKMARHFRLAALDLSVQENLEELEEFDEEWEQVLYRACRNNSYLAARALSVSRLLNLIASLVPENEVFESEVERILGLASVTTVSTVDTGSKKQSTRVRLASVEDFIALQKQEGVRDHILDVWTRLLDDIRKIFGDLIRFEIAPGGIAVMVVNNRSNERRLVKLDARLNSVSIRAGKLGSFSLRTLEPGEAHSLPDDFFENLRKRFKKLSLDKLPQE
ncbi:KAP family NTPase [Desulfovibrio sp. OttesenSCG-928-I05]|nr:KAP family NTPase [Desulfovibrio sp. OttesenSCG-928-I05]